MEIHQDLEMEQGIKFEKFLKLLRNDLHLKNNVIYELLYVGCKQNVKLYYNVAPVVLSDNIKKQSEN